MQNVLIVLKFGWPYIRKYWLRFYLGVALGFVFAMSNGLFVGGASMLVSRMDPKGQQQLQATAAPALASPDEAEADASGGRTWKAWWKGVKAEIGAFADVWLPRAGQPLTWQALVGGVSILPIIAIARGFSCYLNSYLMAWVSHRVICDLKHDVFRKLTSLSLDFHNHASTGDVLIRVNGDTNALNGCLSLGLSDLVKEPATVITVLIAMWMIDPQLTIFSMIFVPMCVIPTKLLGDKVRKASRMGTTATTNMHSIIVEAMQNMRVVKAFGLESQQQEEFRKTTHLMNRMGMRMMQSKALLNPILEVFAAMGIGVVVVFVIVAERRVDVLAGFIMALTTLYAPLKKLGGIHLYFSQTAIGVERLMDILGRQPTVQDRPDARPVPSFNHSIVLHDVSFTYDGQTPVLQDINLKIRRGQKVGLAGESGSGKSSLINILFRFYDPTGGTLLWDNVDARSLKMAEMRQHMALVSQDTLLFNVSIAENIAYGRPGASRDEIIEAAKAAMAHDFIMAQPQGYDTMIGERGIRLSGGQRQRLAIARAFVRNAPVLVLDEATASLDSASEAEVQKAIDALAANRTVISIAHRLSTLANCDEIIVLEKGRIVEQGSFDELILKGGLFASMAARQGIHRPLRPQTVPIAAGMVA